MRGVRRGHTTSDHVRLAGGRPRRPCGASFLAGPHSGCRIVGHARNVKTTLRLTHITDESQSARGVRHLNGGGKKGLACLRVLAQPLGRQLASLVAVVAAVAFFVDISHV